MSVGAMLAAAREAADLSIEDVSQQSRIRATVVRAIEANDFSLCGGDVYARGHLRSIASIVGLDPVPLIAEYDAEHSEAGPSASAVFEAETLTAPRRGLNWSAVMAAALVIAVGLVAVQVFGGGDEPGRDRTTVASPAPPESPAPSDSSGAEPEESPTTVAQVPEDVTVKLTALPESVSWVQVSDHTDAVLFSGELAQGQSKTFKDPKRLQIVLGNAAGVSLFVNGSDLGTPGASGEVARLTFTPEDPEGSAG